MPQGHVHSVGSLCQVLPLLAVSRILPRIGLGLLRLRCPASSVTAVGDGKGGSSRVVAGRGGRHVRSRDGDPSAKHRLVGPRISRLLCLEGLGAEIIGKGEGVAARVQKAALRRRHGHSALFVLGGHGNVVLLHIILGPAESSHVQRRGHGDLIGRSGRLLRHAGRHIHAFLGGVRRLRGLLSGCQRIPVHSHNGLDAELTVLKKDAIDLAVQIAHGRHVNAGVVVVILAQSAGQREGHICDNLVVPPLLCIVGGALHGQCGRRVVVLVVAVKSEDVHGLLVRAGYHGVGQRHLPALIHGQHGRGRLRLHKAVVHHIAAHRHSDIVGSRRRRLGGHSRGCLLQGKSQGRCHSLLDAVGGVGGSRHAVQPLQALGVCVPQSYDAALQPLHSGGKLALVDLHIGPAEIVACNLQAGDHAVRDRHGSVDVVFTELVYVERPAARVGPTGSLCSHGLRRPGGQHSRKGQRRPSLSCLFSSHRSLRQIQTILYDNRNPRRQRAGGFLSYYRLLSSQLAL